MKEASPTCHASTAKHEISQIKAWMMAIRLPTLLIPTIQVWTGTCVAFALKGSINWTIACYAWIVALAITIGTNLINDAIDYERGGDPVNRFGQLKMIPAGILSKNQVYLAGIAAFLVALAVPFALHVDVWICFGIVLVSAICGYCYTGGPYPISYLGLSEVFILIFYGGVCVGIPYYAQTYEFSPEILLAAFQMGLLAILPNALNNFRDIKEDAAANKMTLAVRFGPSFAAYEIATLSLFPFVINIIWLFLGHPGAALTPLLILPLALYFVRGVWNHRTGNSLNKYFGLSVLTHFFFGVMLIIGLIIG